MDIILHYTYLYYTTPIYIIILRAMSLEDFFSLFMQHIYLYAYSKFIFMHTANNLACL